MRTFVLWTSIFNRIVFDLSSIFKPFMREEERQCWIIREKTLEWWSNLEFRFQVLRISGLFFMIGTVVEHVNSGISDPWNPQETGGFDFSLVHMWVKNYEL